MSAGIVSYGAYIPMYRMSLDTLGKVWGFNAGKNEKAIANWDEDSLTMAVEAAIDCFRGQDRSPVELLYVATTTPPYREKQTASIIAKVLDLRRDIAVADFTDSVRSATIAFRAATDAVNAGTAKRALVAATDCRVAAPNSELEQQFGDGAAALLLGNTDVAVEIEGSYSISSEFVDIWKKEKDTYMQAWEDRFIIEHGYMAHIEEVITGLFNKYKVGPKDFAKVVLYAYNNRRQGDLAKKLGFTPNQIQDSLISKIGHTGTPSTMMMLVAALEEAKAGDRILWINYSDGADAYMLKVTDLIEKVRDRRGIKRHLASKLPLPNYGMYLQFRNLMEWEGRFQAAKYTSLPMTWRDRDWIWSFIGARCKKCGTVQMPPQRMCTMCQTEGQFEPVKLADKQGKVFTYSLDLLAAIPDAPNAIAMVDLDGGGRFSTSITDKDPNKLTPDMTVELTFRKFHEGKGVINYFWKCRPIRA